MPLACDPRQTTDVHLPADDGAPSDSRPEFTYRFLTVAEYFERRRTFAEREQAADDEATNAKITEALAVGLVGWRNLTAPDGTPIPYTGKAAEMDKSLGYLEKIALFARVTAAVSMGAAEKKSSESPPSSSPTPSVGGASPPATA